MKPKLTKRKLIISIILDILGFASYLFPLGWLTDIIYAPIYGWWVYKAYGMKKAAWFAFTEELLPFTDAIPTATLTHLYRLRKKV